jgi:PilZ domain-containing protein/transcription initiation factor TFIIS-like protein
MVEQRRSRRIFMRVPIRVRGRDESGKEFSEETTTIEISRGGARICLKSVPGFGTSLEVTNLSTRTSSSFLVIHPCSQSYSGLPEWGIACPKPSADFWGLAFGEGSDEHELVISALLACKECGRKETIKLTQLQYRGLEEESLLNHACPNCQKTTVWEIVVGEEEDPKMALPDSPSVKTVEWPGGERRGRKRLAVTAPILVATTQGATEVTEIYDISKGGLKFASVLELDYGDEIQVTVNYAGSENARAESCRVVWRKPKEKASRYIYGVEFIEKK